MPICRPLVCWVNTTEGDGDLDVCALRTLTPSAQTRRISVFRSRRDRDLALTPLYVKQYITPPSQLDMV